jgi:primosomal protein N' (replication factor Y)
MASVAGPASAVEALLAVAALPASAEILGPLPVAGRPAGPPAHEPVATEEGAEPVRYLVRVPRSEGTKLAVALRTAQAVRTAAKDPGAVRVQLDPAALI